MSHQRVQAADHQQDKPGRSLVASWFLCRQLQIMVLALGCRTSDVADDIRCRRQPERVTGKDPHPAPTPVHALRRRLPLIGGPFPQIPQVEERADETPC
jgi:hypothetical protein